MVKFINELLVEFDNGAVKVTDGCPAHTDAIHLLTGVCVFCTNATFVMLILSLLLFRAFVCSFSACTVVA